MKYFLMLGCLLAACADDGGSSDDVGEPPVTQLVFRQQPGDAEEGVPLGVISIAAEDADGNDVVTASGSVHLSLGANPSAASLGGGVDAALVDGVATLSGITVSAEGTGYTLMATSELVDSSATSSPFNVTVAISPTLSTLVVTPRRFLGTIEKCSALMNDMQNCGFNRLFRK